MKQLTALAIAFSSIALVSCGKKAAAPPPAPVAAAPAPTPAPAPAAAPADDGYEQRQRQKKQAQLDYATMEDQYINDPRGQWATEAKASSTFGDDHGKQPGASNLPSNVAGPVDGRSWTNNHQDIGFDWLETTFAKPVSATEVRIVFPSGEGVEAINKLELQDTDGKWTTVWSGLSDVKADRRGSRTWFVRSFDKTAYKVKAVKFTIANNVQNSYKVVDSVQLVGD